MKKKGNRIGWCDITVNPVTGCPNGCEYCYARSMNNRYRWVEDFSKPEFFPHRLKDFRTKEPLIIFIDSMSDIGHWKDDWFYSTYAAMNEVGNPNNIYLALTKCYRLIDFLRSEISRMDSYRVPEKKRFFIGATVTNNAQAEAVIAAGGADFISFEPLLERIKPELLERLQCKWWIVGDLTKNGKPQGVTQYDWVCDMEYQSDKYKIPLFVKDSLIKLYDKSFYRAFPEGWRQP